MILSIDIETYSEVDLGKAGVYRYAEDPSFEILLLAYAFDDDRVDVIDLTPQRPDLAVAEKIKLDSVVMALQDPDVVKSAYNANFERTCLAAYLGIPMPPEQWQDTMIIASELGLPRSLADVGTVLGLSEDQQKMREGRNLIQYFSKPCKPTKSNGGRTRNFPEHAPDKWEVFKTYCGQDVVTERAIREKLSRFSVDPAEWDLWRIDQKINDRGVRFDRRFVENAVRIDTEEKDALLEEMQKISGLENPNSVLQVSRWVEEVTGVEPESLDKRAIGDLIEALDGYPEVVRVLQLRQARNKTSTTKYQKMLGCACRDDRIRGLTQFYGANRTGRWSGRLVQMQNLAKNNMPDDELDTARILVKSGDVDGLRMMYEPRVDGRRDLAHEGLRTGQGYLLRIGQPDVRRSCGEARRQRASAAEGKDRRAGAGIWRFGGRAEGDGSARYGIKRRRAAAPCRYLASREPPYHRILVGCRQDGSVLHHLRDEAKPRLRDQCEDGRTAAADPAAFWPGSGLREAKGRRRREHHLRGDDPGGRLGEDRHLRPEAGREHRAGGQP